ncbi:MAG: AAA family ATPase, partial [Gammaproteobacteria bacterium]
VTKQLAELLGIEFIRFDMSEYMEKHTASRLIGAPPGYVGFEGGGLLTETVSRHPHSVLLLDEVEKAHPDLFNLLLQVMDYGTLTDSNGRKADFRHVIIVMTTNVGMADMARNSVGFVQQDHNSDKDVAVNNLFSPEFRNRLDAIIHFSHLSQATIRLVANKFIAELAQQLQVKSVDLTIDQSACDWLADNGYDKSMGARNMDRFIEKEIKRPLADELLVGKLSQGGRVRLVAKDNELVFEIASAVG